MIPISKDFAKYLKEKKVYSEFMYNVKYHKAIGGYFNWKDTSQGFSFWFDIYRGFENSRQIKIYN